MAMKYPIPSQVRTEWRRFAHQHEEIKSITLFGSRARGDNDMRSDIDIAVSAPKASQKQWLEAFFYFRDKANTLLPIDVVKLEEAPKKLKTKINKEGISLYERKNT